MTHSMTAYARHSQSLAIGLVTWEVRSINHRYLEIQVRTSENLRPLEPFVREYINGKLTRGKIDVNLSLTLKSDEQALELNQELLASIINANESIRSQCDSQTSTIINTMDVLRWPNIIKGVEFDVTDHKDSMLTSLDTTLSALIEMRAREGAKLSELIMLRLEKMEQECETIQKRVPIINDLLRKRIHERLEDLPQSPDGHRIEQEIAMLLQKSDIAEEVDRLNSHISEVKHIVKKGGVCGRRLDFLMQELHREANTLGSKSIDYELSTHSVELKVLIDQMREQVQNIE